MNEKPQFLKGLFSIRSLSGITVSRHSLVVQLSSSRQSKQKICLHVAKKQGLLIDVLFRAFTQPLPTYIGSLCSTPCAPPGRFTVDIFPFLQLPRFVLQVKPISTHLLQSYLTSRKTLHTPDLASRSSSKPQGQELFKPQSNFLHTATSGA